MLGGWTKQIRKKLKIQQLQLFRPAKPQSLGTVPRLRAGGCSPASLGCQQQHGCPVPLRRNAAKWTPFFHCKQRWGRPRPRPSDTILLPGTTRSIQRERVSVLSLSLSLPSASCSKDPQTISSKLGSSSSRNPLRCQQQGEVKRLSSIHFQAEKPFSSKETIYLEWNKISSTVSACFEWQLLLSCVSHKKGIPLLFPAILCTQHKAKRSIFFFFHLKHGHWHHNSRYTTFFFFFF